MLGRFEEDEFAVIMSSENRRAAAMLVEAIRASLMRPFFVDRMWQLTASIGIAQAPEDGTSGEELVRRAGLALRAAKREGRGTARRSRRGSRPTMRSGDPCCASFNPQSRCKRSMSNISRWWPPRVAPSSGSRRCCAGLIRPAAAWRRRFSFPSPSRAVSCRNSARFVLRRALTDGARWPGLSIAVNLSPVQIRDRWLVDLVRKVMAETGIAPSRVVLEVTEGVLIDNPQEAQTRLESLRALGVSLALDDFGTGYSSLNYLQKFPFDRIKIDRAFVASLGVSGDTAAIIQAIVTLGHALGMKVLAEGVENDEQRVLLRLAGCDEMQGYLFARPGPAAEIDRLLAGSPRSVVA